MSTVIAEKLTFEEKMKLRIKDGIGDLLSDEDLSKMINTAMYDIFLKERKSSEHYNAKTLPPFLHEIVKEAMEVRVKSAVSEYIKDNPDCVQLSVAKVVQEGAGFAFVKALNALFQQDLATLQYNIQNNLQNNRY